MVAAMERGPLPSRTLAAELPAVAVARPAPAVQEG